MCTVTVPDKNATGDNLYAASWGCQQQFIDYFWYTYGFSDAGDTWKNGWGYEAPCDTDYPLARTFNACFALTYSAEDYLNDAYDAPQNILQWGRRFVRENIDDLRAGCGDGSAISDSVSGFWVDDHVDLYVGFFYTEDAATRASTFIHEARHQSGKPHNANFPPGSAYGTGDQADSDWNYQGAWTFQVGWLAWYYAAGARTTPALRQLARQNANFYLENAFAIDPGFRI